MYYTIVTMVNLAMVGSTLPDQPKVPCQEQFILEDLFYCRSITLPQIDKFSNFI